MSTIADLRTALLAYPGLVALVGASGVYVDMAPGSKPFPYVILRQVSNEPTRGLDGSLLARREVFDVESWDDSREVANQVHVQVEAALIANGNEPEAADPDGIDPDVGARACVWVVDVWSV